jgi:hypothetical protein
MTRSASLIDQPPPQTLTCTQIDSGGRAAAVNNEIPVDAGVINGHSGTE